MSVATCTEKLEKGERLCCSPQAGAGIWAGSSAWGGDVAKNPAFQIHHDTAGTAWLFAAVSVLQKATFCPHSTPRRLCGDQGWAGLAWRQERPSLLERLGLASQHAVLICSFLLVHHQGHDFPLLPTPAWGCSLPGSDVCRQGGDVGDGGLLSRLVRCGAWAALWGLTLQGCKCRLGS